MTSCEDWGDLKHNFFQIANLFFGFSFIWPTSINYHPYFLRAFLSLGSLFLVLWGGGVVCHADVMIWYTVFLLINSAYLIHLFYQLYPVKIPKEYEGVYEEVFKSYGVSRYQFRELCCVGKMHDLEAGETYAKVGDQAGHRISVLITGKIMVAYEHVTIHPVTPCQFLDSPEFECTGSSNKYHVNISAVEASLILTWERAKLSKHFEGNPYMAAVFTSIVGKDMTNKLFQVQETVKEIDSEDDPHEHSVVNIRKRLSLSIVAAGSKDVTA